MPDTNCPHCGVDYADPNEVATDEYMYQGRVLNECQSPDRMERAYLNASPAERAE